MIEASLTSDEERALVVELAALVVTAEAPGEMMAFDENVEDYFKDPDAALRAGRAEEEVGSGLEDIWAMTPWLLTVLMPVVQYLAGLAMETVKTVVVETAKVEGPPRLAAFVRRVFRRSATGDGPAAGEALTVGQARHIRQIVREKALALKLSESRAALLADSVAGQLLTAGRP